jgi:hypothetical protein
MRILYLISVVSIMAGVTCVSSVSRAQSADDLCRLTEEWVQLRSQLAAERADWDERKSLLSEEQSLLDQQIDAVREQLQALQGELQDLRIRYETMAERQSTYDALLTASQPVVARALSSCHELATRLPPALQLDLSAGLGVDTDTPASEYLAKTLPAIFVFYASIQEANLKEQAVAVVLTPPDGKPREMDALFLGTALSFAVSRDVKYAAVGRPTESQWVWVWDNSLSRSIHDALAVHAGDAPAGLVTLPLRLENR